MIVKGRCRMTESCLRVPADELQRLVTDLFETVGISRQDASLMARLLVETDLRGVFSHGTRQTPGYVCRMRDGTVNPRPTIRVVSETRTTQVLDGDGGLGHHRRATRGLIGLLPRPRSSARRR